MGLAQESSWEMMKTTKDYTHSSSSQRMLGFSAVQSIYISKADTQKWALTVIVSFFNQEQLKGNKAVMKCFK